MTDANDEYCPVTLPKKIKVTRADVHAARTLVVLNKKDGLVTADWVKQVAALPLGSPVPVQPKKKSKLLGWFTAPKVSK